MEFTAQIINDKRIAILMATYNGGVYLREQLDSIIRQTNKDWKLYIRDDGSTDETLEIIKGYVEKSDSIVLIQDSLGSRGAAGNFFALLGAVDSWYYMFADQDDVWLPDKVASIYSYIMELEIRHKNKPIVIGTDLKVVDVHLNTLAESFWSNSKIRVSLLKKFNYLAVCNGFTGCTMIINDQVKQLIMPTLPTLMIHDYWIALNVSRKGGVIEFMDNALILYRQHNRNVIGSQTMNMTYFFGRFKVLNSVYTQNRELYKMINTICYFSIIKFLWYKFLYMLRR